MAHPFLQRGLPIALLSGLLACSGPVLVFPGGALDGPVEPAPESFGFTAKTTIQLETRPGDPYSVNISCFVVDGKLYVNAGDTKARWVENMEADPRVRIRIDGILYELEAHRVLDDAALAAFAKTYTAEFSMGRDPTQLDVAWVYRLDPR